jgi:alkylation response protein AidB-like acyl-CoA dehydrogenase
MCIIKQVSGKRLQLSRDNRFYEGPSEVHRMSLARRILATAK